MGIRFNANTWRAPLQLIDCWLPQHSPTAIAPLKPTPRLLQRFAKAGWLHRSVPPTATVAAGNQPANPLARHRSIDRVTGFRQWNVGSRTTTNHHQDGRLVLSGRIDQVCAELERLAALEQRMFQ